MQQLIVTLALDDVPQAAFDRLRRAHFPPERNHLAAHSAQAGTRARASPSVRV